jgi:hypothetical protein
MIRKGTVLYLEDEDKRMFGHGYRGENEYEADVIICGDKIIKNRWGKHGTIGEPYLEQQIEYSLRILLDIWNKMGGGNEIKELDNETTQLFFKAKNRRYCNREI